MGHTQPWRRIPPRAEPGFRQEQQLSIAQPLREYAAADGNRIGPVCVIYRNSPRPGIRVMSRWIFPACLALAAIQPAGAAPVNTAEFKGRYCTGCHNGVAKAGGL